MSVRASERMKGNDERRNERKEKASQENEGREGEREREGRRRRELKVSPLSAHV